MILDRKIAAVIDQETAPGAAPPGQPAVQGRHGRLRAGDALCGQHRTVPDFDVAAICQTPGRSWWVRLPSNIKEKGMGCLANRRKGVLVFWWLGRDGTDRTGACTGEKN